MKTWTTKDGREIRVVDMSTAHIRSAMRMLERRADAVRALHFLSMMGAGPHGDGACLAFERELDSLGSADASDFLESDYRDIYKSMERELERREAQSKKV